jgi:uncharacterized membrane protein
LLGETRVSEVNLFLVCVLFLSVHAEQALNLYHYTESDGVVEEERRNRISKMAQIEDLQAQDGHPFAPLSIKVLLCLKN